MDSNASHQSHGVRTLVVILAGGVGRRLYPLTRDRSKPAVPFGGPFRIIDFTLSNCINSRLRRIDVLTQYKSLSLQEHLADGWSFLSRETGDRINIIPPQQRAAGNFYLGTADAIYQNIYSLERERPDRVVILSGDHVYKMDYAQMLRFHEQKRADLTVACIQVPLEDGKRFGVMQVNADSRVVDFKEKPQDPETMPGQPDRVLASMGIYVFGTEALVRQVTADARKSDAETQHDFGKNIIPAMVKPCNVYAYDFRRSPDGRRAYWRDIGTRDAYWQANMDLLEDDAPFSLFDPDWPIRTFHRQCPPTMFTASGGADPAVSNSLISDGCIIDGARINRCVISPSVRIEPECEVTESVIMEGVVIGRGAKIRRALIDKGTHVPPGCRIGFDSEHDAARFTMTTNGIAVLPKLLPME